MPIEKTLSAGQSEPIYNGTEIEFIGGYPAYTASIVNGCLKLTAKDVHLAKELGFPASIEAKKSPFTVGRSANEADFVLGHSMISRSHGVFSFSNGAWYYSHYGLNPTVVSQIERPLALAEDDHAVLHGTVRYRDSTPSKQEIEPFEIVSGTIFQFHPHLPCYEAKVIDDKLVLSQTSGKESDARYPSRISVYRDGIILGRGMGQGRIALPHPKISANHAMIEWHRESKSFIYTSLGTNQPIIRIPQVINQTIHEPQKQISLGEIKKQKSAIEGLKEELAKRHFNLKSVGQLEQHTIYTPSYKIDEGGHSENSLDGYALWLKAFELINHDNLTAQESSRIKYCASAIDDMKEGRIMLRNFEERARNNPPANLDKLHKSAPKAFNQYVDAMNSEFNNNGIVVLLAGFHQHHAVASIYKQEGKTYLAEYNAGGGSRNADHEGYVYGTYVREIKPETNVKELIWNISNRKVWGQYDTIGLALEKKISESVYPQPVHTVEVAAQQKGNCTTRSTREMLRHYLGEKLISKIHEFVSDPERLNKLDVISALDAKLIKLEALEKNGKANTLIGAAGPAINK